MSTQYNIYGGSMNDLESYLNKNKSMLNRLAFNLSWQWIGSTYVESFRVNLYDDENLPDYALEENKLFFNNYKIEKEIGYWRNELFKELNDLIKVNNIPFESSSISTINTCFVYSRWSNIENVNKITELLETEFSLKTKVEFVEKGHYNIYIHRDQSVLDALIIKEKKPVKIKEELDRETLLLKMKDLEKELDIINKQLKKIKI